MKDIPGKHNGNGCVFQAFISLKYASDVVVRCMEIIYSNLN